MKVVNNFITLVLLTAILSVVTSTAAVTTVSAQTEGDDNGGNGSEGNGAEGDGGEGRLNGNGNGNGDDSSGDKNGDGDAEGDDNGQTPLGPPPVEPETEAAAPALSTEPAPPVLVLCPDGITQVEEGNEEDCPAPVPAPVPAPNELPLCDGSFQDCITEEGFFCEAGSTAHECELPPSMPGDAIPFRSAQSDTEQQQTFNPDEECLFDSLQPKCTPPEGTECPEGFLMNMEGGCYPEHTECPEGYHSTYDDETGECNPNVGDTGCENEGHVLVNGNCQPAEDGPEPLPPCHPDEEVSITAVDPICEAPIDEPGKNYDPRLPDADDLDCSDVDGEVEVIGEDVYGLDKDDDGIGCEDDDKDEDLEIIIRNINFFEESSKHGHESLPGIDIIGLSVQQNGDAMVCLMNIGNDQIQCQEFGIEPERVNGDFWRVIETDHDENFDNGNTGSNDIDAAIEDIKSQGFSELDDADNHDFGIDLAWIAINPQGDGVVCLSEDSRDEGKSLCEPFAVSSEDVDGQITEGV